jgi:hypothetical protein
MAANQEGIGVLKLECPQTHPVGRILKEHPHQMIAFDPGAVVGDRRFWPGEGDQPQFKVHCRFCDKPVGEPASALQAKLATLIDDAAATVETATLPYL